MDALDVRVGYPLLSSSVLQCSSCGPVCVCVLASGVLQIMVATMILSSFIVPLALLLPPIREPCPAGGSASATTSSPDSAADTNSSSAPPPPLAACDGSLFEVTPTFVAGTALKVVTASLFPVGAPHELLLDILVLVLAYVRV